MGQIVCYFFKGDQLRRLLVSAREFPHAIEKNRDTSLRHGGYRQKHGCELILVQIKRPKRTGGATVPSPCFHPGVGKLSRDATGAANKKSYRTRVAAMDKPLV